MYFCNLHVPLASLALLICLRISFLSPTNPLSTFLPKLMQSLIKSAFMNMDEGLLKGSWEIYHCCIAEKYISLSSTIIFRQ